MVARRVSCGYSFHCVLDISNTISFASDSGYRFVAVPIAHARHLREFVEEKAKKKSEYFTRPDLVLNTQDWNTFVVGKVSPFLQLDSKVPYVRKNSEKQLTQEVSYAAHLGLPAVMVKLTSNDCVNLARCIVNKLHSSIAYQAVFQVWVHVPIESPEVQSATYFAAENSVDETKKTKQADTWEWWNTFRSICSTDRRIGLALEVSANLPDKEVIDRWLGEPIRCALLPTSIFMTNKAGYPVLSRAHQDLIFQLFKLDVQFLIMGCNLHKQIKFYQQYLAHLFATQEPLDSVALFAQGYEDYLQIPLQPLMDNLESCTYETFEKDPTKYTEYQRAMHDAFLDKVPEGEKESKTLVVMVVGAGRGPLVRAALAASEKAGRKIIVYAVEKNPNAVITLKSQQEEMWKEKVVIVSSDMRDWEAPVLADVIVSELLGSFGDNELSPECLDGVQKLLKEDGISIPCSYASYLSPLQSHKLYSEVAQFKDKDKPLQSPFEVPYVVRLHNHVRLAPPQTLFDFQHPKTDQTDDNTRYKSLRFTVGFNCVLHGFSGYFDTVLYKDVVLSILPETHSPGMFSWFPIFFPLKEPVQLEAGNELEVHFWRCKSSKNVWYEWCVTKPSIGHLHNSNGRSYTIGL